MEWVRGHHAPVLVQVGIEPTTPAYHAYKNCISTMRYQLRYWTRGPPVLF